MEALVIFWLICGVIAYYIYKGKGRPGYWGCIIGTLLGPLGILYAAVRSPRPDHLEADQLRAGTHKRCVKCAELVRMNAQVCKHCGYEFDY